MTRRAPATRNLLFDHDYACSVAITLSTLLMHSYFLYIGIAQYKAPFKIAAVIGPAQ
jgi:hypothetical protein